MIVTYSVALFLSLTCQPNHCPGWPMNQGDPLMMPGEHVLLLGGYDFHDALIAKGFGPCFVLEEVRVNDQLVAIIYKEGADEWRASSPIKDGSDFTLRYKIASRCEPVS